MQNGRISLPYPLVCSVNRTSSATIHPSIIRHPLLYCEPNNTSTIFIFYGIILNASYFYYGQILSFTACKGSPKLLIGGPIPPEYV